ncbi:Putative uridylate kinase [Candidatus Arthromitus sp. SFB-4]|nr:Putative uridylate kinase [Candidatus Arthromitus sp. SFB-4]
MEYKFKRVLLKLSGEALAGNIGFGIDFEVLERFLFFEKKKKTPYINLN